MRYWGLALCAALAALNTGCGGGGGGGSSAGLTPVHVSVDWVVRSAASTPGTASSALLTLSGASVDGSDFTWVIDRSDPVGAGTGIYTSPAPARVGTWPLAVRFYDQPRAAGAIVGASATTVTVNSDGSGIRSLSPQRTACFLLTSDGASAVPISVSPQDTALMSAGSTPFARMWDAGATVSFLAPEVSGDLLFSKWVLNGADASTSSTLSLTEGVGGYELEAVYVPATAYFVPNYATDSDPQTGKPNTLSHWAKFPIKVAFARNSSYSDDRRARATAGFDWWVKATGGAISYALVDDPANADVTLTFANNGQTGWAGLTEYTVGSDETMLGARITMNLSYLSKPANITPATAHEFGHALGIRGHSSDPGDLMGYSPNVYNLSGPSTRDLNTLKADYWSLFTSAGRFVRRGAPEPARTAAVRCAFGSDRVASR